jgi:tRNA-modifying protein YgfZ
MAAPKVAALSSRAVLHVGGAEAGVFLDRIVTVDVDGIAPGEAGYGALLSPQGKVLTDFLLVPVDDGFLVDCPAAAAADLVRRLTLYRLRAPVAIADVSGDIAVLAIWDLDAPPPMPGRIFRDPRHPSLGFRALVPRAAVGAAEGFEGAMIEPEHAYHAHRAALAIPEIGIDVVLGEAFPHEVAMDALSGVSFDKGCYVGQEVVSRMQHRATARRRPVAVSAETQLPEPGTHIEAGGKAVGSLGSSAGTRGVAIVRLDRVRDAIDAGLPITAGVLPVTISLPDWAPYGWPATDGG